MKSISVFSLGIISTQAIQINQANYSDMYGRTYLDERAEAMAVADADLDEDIPNSNPMTELIVSDFGSSAPNLAPKR